MTFEESHQEFIDNVSEGILQILEEYEREKSMATYIIEGTGWGSNDRKVTASELEAEFFGYYPTRDRSDFYHFIAQINGGAVEYLASLKVWKNTTQVENTEVSNKYVGCQHERKYTNTAAGKSFVVCPDCKQEVI